MHQNDLVATDVNNACWNLVRILDKLDTFEFFTNLLEIAQSVEDAEKQGQLLDIYGSEEKLHLERIRFYTEQARDLLVTWLKNYEYQQVLARRPRNYKLSKVKALVVNQ